MRYAIIVIGFASFLCWLLACQQPAKHPKLNAKSTDKIQKKDTCGLYVSDGHDVFSKLGCISCHLHGDGHVNDSTQLSDFGKKQTVNLKELAKLDSGHIRRYLFPSAHQGLLKHDTRLTSLTDCEFRQMMYYFRHIDDMQYGK